MQETLVQSLGPEDPLEESMATHSSTLAWRTPWTEESGGLQSIGLQRIEHDRSDLAYTNRGVVLTTKNSTVSIQTAILAFTETSQRMIFHLFLKLV